MANKYSTVANYLLCRTLGHSWEPVPAEYAGPHGGDPMWIRCMRCGTERHDEVNRGSGNVISRRYVYDDSYRHAFDSSFADALPTRSDFRMMYLAEQIAEQRGKRVAANNHPSTRSNQQRKAN